MQEADGLSRRCLNEKLQEFLSILWVGDTNRKGEVIQGGCDQNQCSLHSDTELFSSTAVIHYYQETEMQILNNLTPLTSFTGRMGENNTIPLLLSNDICKTHAGHCISWSLLFLTCFSLSTSPQLQKRESTMHWEAFLFLSCLMIH